MNNAFWIVADILDQYGVEAGFIILVAPILYDVIGIAYGRDLHIKVETFGVVIQIIGAVVMALSKWIKKATRG